jgi:hypothetical protein
MLTLRIKLLNGLDRLTGLAMAGLLLGSSLAFGGVVWWGGPVISGLATAMVLAWLGRSALVGRWRVMKSPLTALAVMAVLLAVAQLLPWPAAIVERVSPRSMAVISFGMIPEQGLADDPSASFPTPFLSRSPLSVDRAATLRWVVGALACLGVFVVASHSCDRFRKAQLVWGSVVAAFFVNAVIGAVQVSSQAGGLYGMFTPGSGPIWAPNLVDALAGPSVAALRPIGDLDPAVAALAAVR